MPQNASWWDNPDAKDDSPVVRHAPDRHQYHYPDHRELDRMPGSKVGAFAVIPAARKDGGSCGFDASTPSVVHVDPDAPDGGAIVDCAQLSKRDVNSAVATSTYPHEVFYKLGVSGAAFERRAQQRELPPAPRQNPVMPGAYVVPAARTDGGQTEFYNPYNPSYPGQEAHVAQQSVPSFQQPAPAPTAMPAAPPQNLPQAQPQQAPPAQYAPQYPQQPQYPPQYAQQPYYGQPQPVPPMDPQLAGVLSQLSQGLQNVTAQMAQMQQAQRTVPQAAPVPRLATTPASPAPYPQDPATNGHQYMPIGQGIRRRREEEEEEDEDGETHSQPPQHMQQQEPPRRRSARATAQRVDAVKAAQTEQAPAIVAGFETLEIPFVNGPIPVKALRNVVFQFPQLGSQSAMYHDVIVAKDCVALVYDTRYEDGQQYIPPDMSDAQILLHVPHLNKTFQVSSMGLLFNCGTLDFTVLVLHEEGPLNR
jgi:hypothetical protein